MVRRKPTVEMRAGRMARNAAKIIRKHGWSKGAAQDKKGGLCVRAAFAAAYEGTQHAGNNWARNEGPVGETCKVFRNWLFEDYEERFALSDDLGIVHGWNDTPSGKWKGELAETAKFLPPDSAEEIIAILDKFADEMDPQR